MSGPAIYDHFRPTNGTAPPGVYRVVGVDGDHVTLLRVADGDGRRVHEGAVDSVSRDRVEAAFTAARNPDANGTGSGSGGRLGRLHRALSGVGVGFGAVAVLSWLGLLATPAPPATLAALGVSLVAAGRLLDRIDRGRLRR
jgi:hypothetical protein